MAKTKRGAKRSTKKGSSKGKGKRKSMTKRVSPMSLAARMRIGIQEGVIGDELARQVDQATHTVGQRLAAVKGDKEEDRLLRTTGKFLMTTPGKKGRR